MRFADIELISLKYALDEIGIVYTTKAAVVDPALSIDENFYNTMVMEETVITQADPEAGIEYSEHVIDIKPPLAELIARKNEYEEQLKEARRQELRDMCRGRELDAIYSTGLVYTKAQSQFDSYINTDNEEEILKLVDIIDAIETAEFEANTIKYGDAVSKICSDTLSYITGMNALRGLTGAQVDSLQANFSDVETALRSQRPSKALGLITAIVADGVLITEDDKTKIINFLTKKLSQQG